MLGLWGLLAALAVQGGAESPELWGQNGQFGVFGTPALHPELFPQCGQPGSCLCSEQMVQGEGRGWWLGLAALLGHLGHPMARSPIGTRSVASSQLGLILLALGEQPNLLFRPCGLQ